MFGGLWSRVIGVLGLWEVFREQFQSVADSVAGNVVLLCIQRYIVVGTSLGVDAAVICATVCAVQVAP